MALRVLGMAYRRLAEGETIDEFAVDRVGRDFSFVGLQGMIDPPRPEATEAIQGCKASRHKSGHDHRRSRHNRLSHRQDDGHSQRAPL